MGAADTSRGVRAAAIESLVRNGGAEGAGSSKRLTESGAAEVQARVLAALLEADAGGTTPRVVAWLGRLAPDQFGAAAIVLARVLELRGAPVPAGVGSEPARADPVGRSGQAVRSPGPRLGPRRARP